MTRLPSLLLTALCASATPLLAQDWLIDHAVAAMDLSQRIATRQTAGYLPVSLTVDKASGTAEFSIVWARNLTNVTWNVVTDLSQAGLGAELYPASPLFLSIGANNGDAEWTLHVPQNPNLMGAPLHCQVLTFDPLLATQLVTSHLGTLWLGQ
ncbi:MAG: hypothetical protein R3F29_09710 [Planctomycetota bacterium]